MNPAREESGGERSGISAMTGEEGGKEEEMVAESVPLVIVGAGEAALHVLERLPDRLLKKTVVLAGAEGQGRRGGPCFLARSSDKLARLRMEAQVARKTTRMACSSQDSTKLEKWIASKRTDDAGAFAVEPLTRSVENFVACPTLEAVRKFLESRAKRFMKKGLRLIAGRPTSLEVVNPTAVEGEGGGAHPEGHAQLVRMKVSDGSVFLARQVVLADAGTCLGEVTVPAFVGQITPSSGEEENQDWLGAIAYAEIDLDLSEESLDCSGKAICIVGGGMTSVHLASHAIKTLGAERVYLVTQGRAHQRVEPFEVDAGWLGRRHMKEFCELSTPREKMRQYRRNVDRGTLSPDAKNELDNLLQEPTFALFTETSVASAAWREKRWSIDLEGSQGRDAISCEYIWVACGTSFDAMSDPVIQDLENCSSANFCGPYPLLCSDSLSWPGVPNVMCMGATAALALGPTAQYSVGFRAAADKIAKALLDPVKFLPITKKTEKNFAPEDLLYDEGSPDEWDVGPKPTLQLPEIQKRLSATKKEKLGIENYTWSDDDFEIDIYIKLNDTIAKKDVVVALREQSLEVLVETQKKCYYLHIDKLYKPIQLKKSSYRIYEKKGKIVVHLVKRDNHEWMFLKG